METLLCRAGQRSRPDGNLDRSQTNQKYYFRVNNFGYMNFTNLPNRVYIFEIRSKVFGTGITEFYFPFPGVLDLRGSLRTNLTSGIGATVIEPKELANPNEIYRAKTCEKSAKDLNSRALPLGSRKNIVACSPTSPLNRIFGSMTNSTPF